MVMILLTVPCEVLAIQMKSKVVACSSGRQPCGPMSSFGPSVVEVPSPVLEALTCPVVPLVPGCPVVPLVPGSTVVPVLTVVVTVVASVCPCVAPPLVGVPSVVVGMTAVVTVSVAVPAVVPVAVNGLVLD